MRPPIAEETEDGGAPHRAGRYVLGRVLGAGAMGVVRASYDPALDREVAVKLIGGPPGARDTDDDHDTRSQLLPPTSRPSPTAGVDDAQLLAEARALARVAHPNIVEVFDVGVCEGGVFIAMELVDGVPLRAWNDTHMPDWRTAVELHLSAADALAAAHRVGIVHGDFKPDNVLVARDGRVKVVDFGLARAITRLEPVSSDEDASGTAARPTAVCGTPAYLAPECWSDPSRDPSADQFAFFVSLFEAVARRRPFHRQGSLGGLLVQMSEGVDVGPVVRRAPARLVQAFRRGLDPDPGQRFGSMAEVIVELRAVLAAERRRRAIRGWLGGTALAGAVVIAATVGPRASSAWQRRQAIAACETEAAAITAEWTDDARERVRVALLAGDPQTGADVFTRVVSWLDAYVLHWSELRRSTCVRAATEPADADPARDRCFGERRAALAGLVEVLASADDRVVRSAVRTVADLPRVESCDDASWLAVQTSLPVDPPVRDRVAQVEQSLVRADQLAAGGRAAEALEIADAAVASADEIAWPPLLASAHARRGRALEALGRYEEAAHALESAYFLAGEAADDVARAETAAELASLHGNRLVRIDDALAWVRHAETALAAIDGPESETHARLAIATAAIHVRRGALTEAVEPAERALAIRMRIFGPDHPSVGAAHVTLGTTLARLGQTDDALEHFERARAIYEVALGPEHPDLAAVYHALGMANLQLERYDEAQRLHVRALAIREAALGPDHPDVATSLAGIAYADLALVRLDAAERGFRRVLAIREARFGPRHPSVADSLANLAQVADKRGNCREAADELQRALEIVETANPDDLRARLQFGLNLADALRECHEIDRAHIHYEGARTLARGDPARFAQQLARAEAGADATAKD